MIELTDKAYEKLLEKTRGDEGITIALLPGGCAGFEYKLDFIGNRILDSSFQIIDYVNFKIGVDKMSVPYLDGATLDWQQHGINEEFCLLYTTPSQRDQRG